MTPYARYLLWVGLLISPRLALALPPAISLIYPPQGASFSAPATIPLWVSTSDPDGSVVNVEYFLGTAPLGQVTGTIPTTAFSLSLSDVPAGTYSFSAKATDNQGEVTTSNVATITVYSAVTGNTAPNVGLVLPVGGSAYSLNKGPAVVPILANATDSGGVNRIDLFTNGAYRGTVMGDALSGNVTFSSPGNYSVVARAYDNLGVFTDSTPQSVAVYATDTGNTAPTTAITSPPAGASYLPSESIPVTATASDAGGSINRVEFYLNNSLLTVMTAAPYTFGLGLVAGSHSFRARAFDNLGVYTDSVPVQIVVNTPPTVSITAPANNAVISAPASFNLQVSAADADGNLSKVEFYQGSTLLGEDTSSPYIWALNGVSRGSYAYTAKAYDALGAITTSSVRTVIVNEPPTVSLTATSTFGGYNAPADILLTATPSDIDGTVSKVEFYSESQAAPLSTQTTPPYSFTVPGAPAGTYTYTAKAYDNRSAVTTSNPVTVTVAPSLSPATYTYDELGRLVGAQH